MKTGLQMTWLTRVRAGPDRAKFANIVNTDGSYLLINPTHTEVCLAQDLDSGLGLSWSPLSHSREFYTKQVLKALYSWCGGGSVTDSTAWWDLLHRPVITHYPAQSLLFVFTLHTAEIMSVKINFVIHTAGKVCTYCTDMGIVVKLKRQIQPFLIRCDLWM